MKCTLEEREMEQGLWLLNSQLLFIMLLLILVLYRHFRFMVLAVRRKVNDQK